MSEHNLNTTEAANAAEAITMLALQHQIIAVVSRMALTGLRVQTKAQFAGVVGADDRIDLIVDNYRVSLMVHIDKVQWPFQLEQVIEAHIRSLGHTPERMMDSTKHGVVYGCSNDRCTALGMYHPETQSKRGDLFLDECNH